MPLAVKRLAFALIVIVGLVLAWSAMFPVPWFLDVQRWRVYSKLSNHNLVRSYQMRGEAEWGSDPSTYSVDLRLAEGQRMSFRRVTPESFRAPESLMLFSVDGRLVGCEGGAGWDFVSMDVLSRNNSATSHLGIENLGDALEKSAGLKEAMFALGDGTSIEYWGETAVCHVTPPDGPWPP